MPSHRFALTALVLPVVVCAACDAQTTSDYPGELLLSVSGRLVGEIPDGELHLTRARRRRQAFTANWAANGEPDGIVRAGTSVPPARCRPPVVS